MLNPQAVRKRASLVRHRDTSSRVFAGLWPGADEQLRDSAQLAGVI